MGIGGHHHSDIYLIPGCQIEDWIVPYCHREPLVVLEYMKDVAIRMETGVLDGEIDFVHVFTFEPGEFEVGDLVIPEPASMVLLGLGALAAIRRKR